MEADTQNTPVHLLDSARHDLAHSVRHIERLAEEDQPPELQRFNAEHALKHAQSAQEHVGKVFDHLTANDSTADGFSAERSALEEAHEAAREEVRGGKRKGMSNFVKTLPRK